MQSNHKFKSLPIEDDKQKLEVRLENDNQVSLQLSTWTEGLGWCAQKTMSFDAAMLDDLQRALIVARNKINRERSAAGETVSSAKVIRFPFAA